MAKLDFVLALCYAVITQREKTIDQTSGVAVDHYRVGRPWWSTLRFAATLYKGDVMANAPQAVTAVTPTTVDPSKAQAAAPIPADVKSVSTATPVVPRPDEFGASPAAVTGIASGNVKQAATLPPPEPEPEPEAPPEGPPPEESRASKLTRLLDQYIAITPLDGAHFTHKGNCTKCGWQTMQLSANDALTLVRQHVQQHWRDVTALL